MSIGVIDLAVKAETRVRQSNGGDPYFYKYHDIHSYKKPVFPTKHVEKLSEISKYDFHWNK